MDRVRTTALHYRAAASRKTKVADITRLPRYISDWSMIATRESLDLICQCRTGRSKVPTDRL